MRLPWNARRVDVKAGCLAEIVTLRLIGNLVAARAGVGKYDCDAVARGKTLESALGARIVIGAGQSRQPVERRYFFISRFRRQVNREGHLALTNSRLVGIAVQVTAAFLDTFNLFHVDRALKHDHRFNTFAFMHQIEGGIDLFQWHGMCHQAVELDGSIHVLIDHAG